MFIVNVTTMNGHSSFVGILHEVTWDQKDGHCLYVGDSQSDSAVEVKRTNSSVIEGNYQDYIITGAFMDDSRFGVLNETFCY